MSVKPTDCYDELVHERVDVTLIFPNVARITCTAGTSADVYDVLKYFIVSHFSETRVLSHESIYARTHIFCGTKPLKREPIPLSLYGIKNGTTLEIRVFGLLGGSKSSSSSSTADKIFLPTYTHIQECEQVVLKKYKLQSLSTFFHKDEIVSDYALQLIEDVGILAYHMMTASSKSDYAIAALNFAKLRSTGPIVRHKLVKELVEMMEAAFLTHELQSGYESVEAGFNKARSFINDYDAFRKGPLVKKLYKLTMYCLANELFSGAGLTLTKLNYSRLAQEALKREYHMGPSFVQCLLDTTLFLCEQGLQCVKLGSIEPLIHCATEYQKWFDAAIDLQVKSKCLANPKPHGFTKFEFLRDLSAAIEKGEAISKFSTNLGFEEKKLVRNILSTLKMLQADCITKGAAQKTRKAPFSILVYAGSSVGKSTFTDILFTYHGKIAGLPEGSEYRYAVNFADEYQSGFTTSQWCWLIDDVGFQHPNAAQGIDSSLMNVIQANNNAAYVTNQADLPDKGRIPMWCEQVIGTTNVKHLNAPYYFSNPLAVQRRFPFIVELAPKPQFAKDGVMLDGQKVDLVGENEYPDWWNIIVWRVIPQAGQPIGNQRADHEKVLETGDITTFLMWYHKTWKLYDDQQNKVLEGNAKFDGIKLCDCHYVPTKMCPDLRSFSLQAEMDSPCYIRDGRAFPYPSCQDKHGVTRYFETKKERNDFINTEMNVSEDEVSYSLQEMADVSIQMYHNARGLAAAWSDGWYQYCMAYAIQCGLYLFLEFTIFRSCVGWFYTFPVCRNLIWSFIKSSTRDSRVIMHMFGFMGAQAQRRIGKIPFLVTMAGVLTTGLATYKLATWMFSGVKQHSDPNMRAQRASVGTKPTPCEERGSNVWYKDDYVLASSDVPPASKSNALQVGVVTDFVSKQVAKLHCYNDTGGMFVQTIVCVKGQIYVANNHGIPKIENMRVRFSQYAEDGVSGNMEMTIQQSQIHRYPDKDLCFIRFTNLVPKRGIIMYLSATKLQGQFTGNMLTRLMDGSIKNRIVNRCVSMRAYVDEFKQTMDLWECTVDEPTVNGDCGSPVIAATPLGPVIVGIHTLGNGGAFSLAIPLSRVDVDEALKLFPTTVVSGTPQLSAPSAKRSLGDLSAKSTFRYMEEGTAEVLGSFAGWKNSSKSRVQNSIICDAVCDQLNISVQHGAPKMGGWQPWRKAATELVKPTTLVNEDILDKCVEAFKQDIMEGLPAKEWNLIEVYDLPTATNGAAGIKYVDSINKSTSIGAPWRKSKKNFLVDDPTEELPEGVKYTQEVLDRVADIERVYKEGERAMPVYSAQMKDEAMKFKKIQENKLRVFMMAPGDWSLVVRKYFLSCVRVIQRNKTLFESGPGTNAQSLEWQRIGEYLTKFGVDKMIAGDYAAFDKSMPPVVILGAFKILIWMCQQGGFTDEDISVCLGISYDVAFPLVDFNGDLVQLFGSNPSGQPLTVIINGLANSLYMRYGYTVNNPQEECVTFKSNVALMTYGDDNAMGVSKNVPWFNHTRLQNTMADIGIKYTMADKEAESVPYIPFKDVSFLKRTWRWDSDMGCYLAPLEEASIHKMLTVNVASKSICAEAQAIATIESAISEWFFHGKDVYEARCADMLRVVMRCGLSAWTTKNTFPEWETLKKRFFDNSKNVPTVL